MGRSALRTYLAASAAVLLAALLIPSENVKGVLFLLAKLAVAVVLYVAVRRYRPRLALPWLLLAAALLISVLADVAFGIAWEQGTTDSSPLVADALYILGFVPMIAGLALLYRGGAPAGGHRPSRIDAAVVTISIGLLCWVVLIGPTLDDRSLSSLAKALTLAYPIGDLVLVALVASMLLGGWVHTRSQGLLLTAVIGSLLADVLNAVNTLHGGGISFFGLLDVLWMTSNLLLGAAALHPSMKLIGEVSDRTVRLSRSRVVVLAAASLIAVGVVAVQTRQPSFMGIRVVGVGSAILFLLVLTRMVGLVNELRRAQEQRGRLLERTIQAREQERRRLAAELHDGPIQRLAFLTTELELVRRNVRHAQVDKGVEILESVQDRLSDEIGGLRRVMATLRPPSLDEVGLTAALRDHMADLEHRVGVRCELDTDVAVRLDPDLQTVLCRVAQEALTNVGKHASASTCQVSLCADESRVELRIHDDGDGFDPATVGGPERGRYGLVGMRERVEMAGGRCEVSARPNGGVLVRATFPGPVPVTPARPGLPASPDRRGRRALAAVRGDPSRARRDE